jgi:hypothetical protein
MSAYYERFLGDRKQIFTEPIYFKMSSHDAVRSAPDTRRSLALTTPAMGLQWGRSRHGERTVPSGRGPGRMEGHGRWESGVPSSYPDPAEEAPLDRIAKEFVFTGYFMEIGKED